MIQFRSLLTVLAVAAPLLASAPSQAATSSGRACFRMSQMNGWRALPDGRGFYMRVGVSDIYKVDTSTVCSSLQRGGVHLVSEVTNDLICSPVEFDLKVADDSAPMFKESCIVSGFHQLSPQEAAALPKKLKP